MAAGMHAVYTKPKENRVVGVMVMGAEAGQTSSAGEELSIVIIWLGEGKP